MRLPFALVIVLFLLATTVKAEEKQPKLLKQPEDLKRIVEQTGVRQEYVQVTREKYPGLEIEISNPADIVAAYRPPKYKLVSYPSRLRVADDIAYRRSGTGRPYQSGKIVDVGLPTN